jgi:hypothetical protein
METDVAFGLYMYVFLKFFLPTFVLKGTLSKEEKCFWLDGYKVSHYFRNYFLIYDETFGNFIMRTEIFLICEFFYTRSLENFYSVKGGNFLHFFLVKFLLRVHMSDIYKGMDTVREEWILRGPRSSSFWVQRNLFHHIRNLGKPRTGDTVIVKSREMTGRTQTLA